MKTRNTLIALTLAGLTAATLSSVVLAEPGDGPMSRFPFDAVDADKDGKVTKAEFDAFRASQAAAIDTDQDGKVTVEEMTAAHLVRMSERATTMAAEMVEQLDTDGDGALSADEMAARPAPARLFDRADADGDGAVSKAEFDAAGDRMKQRMANRKDKQGHGKQGRDEHRGWDWSWGMMDGN